MTAEPLSVTVVPATEDRFDDVTAMLNPTGREQACWCMHWRLPPREDATRRGEYLRDLTAREPAPGMLAYAEVEGGPAGPGVPEGPGGSEPVGWLGFAPRSLAGSLQRSRVLPRIEPEEWPTTWAVMCVTVRPGFRRRGVARELLRHAVDYAAGHGARVVEGFPVDPGPGARVPVSAAFVGTVGLFESVGFDVVAPTLSTSGRLTRWHVRREL
ncbi:GNAT family N-acetyltransferase [Antribacter gilvus]|uniref:GNAT family N-acetyltransferase n=1 Tax=Antribacter gilvus TaxID=2304675 RepID=UPI000F7A6F0B|nr:GNAT family N-acetyltransferase [Antribacter gilvus]